MGIKWIFVICFSLFVFRCEAQWEEQRKYKCEEEDSLLDFLLKSPVWQYYGIKWHSVYVYSDIYLDTPERDLFKNGYSLRFRRKYDGTDSVTYLLQLKSEMKGDSVDRMEIEETEIEMYRVFSNNTSTLLIHHLNNYFAIADSVPYRSSDSLSLLNIREWINQKADGAIAPFQKLNRLIKENSMSFKIESLLPVYAGLEHRYRLHLYYRGNVGNESSEYSLNKLKANEISEFFRFNPQYIWLAELSLDEAWFWKPDNDTFDLKILELEFENKYYLKEKGTEAMQWLEDELIKKFEISPEKNSKYRQCILAD